MNEGGKQAAGRAAAALVEEGMIVGLGTGSTAALFVEALGERVRAGLRLRGGVPTSHGAERLARQAGIPLLPLTPDTCPDLTVDGADEVDPDLNLTKGGGGALVQEKMVARASKRMVVVADASKSVERLGAFPLPVAVLPFGVELTLDRLRRFDLPGATANAAAALRRKPDGGLYITDDGLNIVDIRFGRIDAPPADVERALRALPGVVEVGLFVGVAGAVLFGQEDGTVREVRRGV